jgi:hypothetical protein
MSSKVDAAANDAEGGLEAAIDDINGDTGHQIKGKAKQVQASAMDARVDLKQAAQSVAKNVSHAAKKSPMI